MRAERAPSPSQRLGRRAERVAAWRLFWRGYRILARNWRCSLGEIDLIALHRGHLVVVEVKARVSEDRLPPEAQVGRDKQWRLCRLLDAYRRRNDLWHLPCRFDVVAVVINRRGRVQAVRVWADAFGYLDA